MKNFGTLCSEDSIIEGKSAYCKFDKRFLFLFFCEILNENESNYLYLCFHFDKMYILYLMKIWKLPHIKICILESTSSVNQFFLSFLSILSHICQQSTQFLPFF